MIGKRRKVAKISRPKILDTGQRQICCGWHELYLRCAIFEECSQNEPSDPCFLYFVFLERNCRYFVDRYIRGLREPWWICSGVDRAVRCSSRWGDEWKWCSLCVGSRYRRSFDTMPSLPDRFLSFQALRCRCCRPLDSKSRKACCAGWTSAESRQDRQSKVKVGESNEGVSSTARRRILRY